MLWRVLSLMLLGLGLHSCVLRRSNESSALRGKTTKQSNETRFRESVLALYGPLVGNPEPWHWLDLDSSKYQTLAQSVAPDALVEAVDDKEYERLQGVLDRLMAGVAGYFPEISKLPRPKIALFRSEIPFAGVVTTGLCWKVPVVSSDKTGRAAAALRRLQMAKAPPSSGQCWPRILPWT